MIDVVLVLVTLEKFNLAPVLLISLALVPVVNPVPVIVKVISPPSAVWTLSGDILDIVGKLKPVVFDLSTFYRQEKKFKQLKVEGIFHSGIVEYDNNSIFLNLKTGANNFILPLIL